MTMVVEKCPLCGGQDHGPFERHEEAGHALQYRLCRTCGLMLQSPRMSDEELAAFYTSSYRLTVQGTEAPTEKDLRMQAGRARHLVRFSQGRLPAVARHLDIGCSSGALLRAFSRSYGCESVGVEPGRRTGPSRRRGTCLRKYSLAGIEQSFLVRSPDGRNDTSSAWRVNV